MRYRVQVLLAIAFVGVAVCLVRSLPTPTDAPVAFEPNDSLQTPLLQDVIERRYQAVEELLAGRKSIAETIARFRALAQEDPLNVLEALHATFPDASTEDDLFFMQVYNYAIAVTNHHYLDDAGLRPLREELRRRTANPTIPARVE
jgi:hypothetical protein